MEKPHYQFNTNLSVGMRNDDVKHLQECLDYLRFYDLPGNYTGYFGGITLVTVKLFQERFADEVLHPLGLTVPTGYVGSSTRKKLNEIFK